ncbi:alpha/beta fold hydrolase [Rossellomorea aquimaris]|uniref:Alpha/beta hydrolase n=1 Tax=Rossellomorea aquimaris TaxID=189382 RepID=A0A5D4TDI5_9BACI|nr:alpha/beta hydrolase [Rossellomorea aquimaris]TYS72572.1 alpha/beta hydrolase [Rossellomorea aquimaris]
MWKWETEQEAKAVIVIIHGAMEHHGRYGWLIEMWRTSGYHVIMGDLPGQGMTSRAQRGHIDSFDEYIIEVKDWVQAAYQFDLPVFVIGHSMGGLVAARMMQESHINIAGLILSSPCLGLVDTPPKPIDLLSHILNKVAPHVKFSSGLSVDLATRNANVREIDSNDSLYVTKVSVRWYRELDKAVKQAFINIGKMPDIPLLVMQGGDDKIVDKSSVKKWFNELSLSEMHYKEWPKFYHEIFNEPERDEVFEYAKTFVETRLKTIGYVVKD